MAVNSDGIAMSVCKQGHNYNWVSECHSLMSLTNFEDIPSACDEMLSNAISEHIMRTCLKRFSCVEEFVDTCAYISRLRFLYVNSTFGIVRY